MIWHMFPHFFHPWYNHSHSKRTFAVYFLPNKKQRTIREWQQWFKYNSFNRKEWLSESTKGFVRDKIKLFREKKDKNCYKLAQITSSNFLWSYTKLFLKIQIRGWSQKIAGRALALYMADLIWSLTSHLVPWAELVVIPACRVRSHPWIIACAPQILKIKEIKNKIITKWLKNKLT